MLRGGRLREIGRIGCRKVSICSEEERLIALVTGNERLDAHASR